jgi:hypothetical protein
MPGMPITPLTHLLLAGELDGAVCTALLRTRSSQLTVRLSG